MKADAGHCLVIDDDADFVAALGGALARRGYLVSTAHDNAAALRALAEATPDDVVLDLRLGEVSGLELIAPLVATNPAVRIVVLTGYASIATAVHAIKLGAVEYLTKPTDADSIVCAFGRHAGDAAIGLSDRPTPLEQLEWEHIQKTLVACAGNISSAATRLGLHRRTLQRKLRKRPAGY